MSGKQRKPLELCIADGTFREDRHGDIGDVILVTGQPSKPDDLTPDASEHWDNVVAELNVAGVLGSIDASALRVLCDSWAGYRRAYKAWWKDPTDHRMRTSAIGFIGQWRLLANAFGLTPSARASLQKNAQHEGPKDDLESLFGISGGAG